MRAKLRVNTVTKGDGFEQLTMSAVDPKGSYPPDGSDEDNNYAKWSPSANFSITINNPNLPGQLAVADKFNVDFTPVA